MQEFFGYLFCTNWKISTTLYYLHWISTMNRNTCFLVFRVYESISLLQQPVPLSKFLFWTISYNSLSSTREKIAYMHEGTLNLTAQGRVWSWEMIVLWNQKKILHASSCMNMPKHARIRIRTLDLWFLPPLTLPFSYRCNSKFRILIRSNLNSTEILMMLLINYRYN